MRYYVYISDSKVEMLYTQIPPKLLENIAGRLTIDLKLIKTEFSESPKEKSLESKLRIVENYLAEKNLIGTISEPKKYFKGICSMKWGPFPGGLVYFGSVDKAIIGLGGSEKHVIGNVGISQAHSQSATPYILAAIKEQIEEFSLTHENYEEGAIIGVELATKQMKGPQQKMEFLAKRLISWPNSSFEYTWGGQSGLPVILGSPIYVAQLD